MAAKMEVFSIADFLREEMQKRNMSAREFSEFIGVSHTSVNKFLEYGKKDVGYPSVEFIVKLARATKSDVGMLVKLVEPDVPVSSPEMSPYARYIAQQIDQLSDKQRQVIEAMIEVLQESGG